jgi:hypothetical protein
MAEQVIPGIFIALSREIASVEERISGRSTALILFHSPDLFGYVSSRQCQKIIPG